MAESRPQSSATLTSSHRLPTISASQILRNVISTNDAQPPICTSLPRLDAILRCNAANTPKLSTGIAPGTITEIWGPPGSGTTAFALQIASNVSSKDRRVIWIDTLLKIPTSRITAAILNKSPDDFNFHHLVVPTLAHLLALILHPPSWLALSSTSLLVLDGLHTLLDAAYPRYSSTRSQSTEPQRWATNRRTAVLATLTSALRKQAAIHQLAVLVTTGCATQTRPENRDLGAVLVPGIVSAEWETAIWTRLVVFRDLCPVNDGAQKDEKTARYIGVQKKGGTKLVTQLHSVGQLVRFVVETSGVREVFRHTHYLPRNQPASSETDQVAQSAIVRPPARKRGFAEVADSEEDDVLANGSDDLDLLNWVDEDVDPAAQDLLNGKDALIAQE